MAEFKHIVRVANTDLQGNKPTVVAMKKIKGVDISYANAALNTAGIDKNKKAGNLLDKEVEKLDDILANPGKYELPEWIYNRRKDYETGRDIHIMGPDLEITKDTDLKRLKKVKSYRGLRHQWGLTTRGQRTKANFRNKRGKGLSVKKKK